ncbi:hypothetical protein [Tistlia consotensis]|nr:hypothetical protein [Tistlia consotensis]
MSQLSSRKRPAVPSGAFRHAEAFATALKAGNEAFSRGAHDRAQALYGRAGAVAARLMLLAAAGQLGPDLAARALADARLNAAHNLLRRARLEEAGRQLAAVFETLCDWRDARHVPEALREACAAELPRVIAALVEQLERSGAEPSAISEVYARAAASQAPWR